MKKFFENEPEAVVVIALFVLIAVTGIVAMICDTIVKVQG